MADNQNNKGNQGFASMSKKRVKEIAAKGGRSSRKTENN